MNCRQQIQARHKKFLFTSQEYISRNGNLENYQFDKYTIVKKIGSGSFATVYLESSYKSNQLKKHQRTQNIKTQTNKTSSRTQLIKNYDALFIPTHYQMLLNLFKAKISNLWFQNIVMVETWHKKVQNQQKLEEDQAISMMRQIVNGLSQCHSKGIIHRDLKLDNIMLHNGVCKLADFGFSKILSINPQNQNQMCMNTTLGTPTTMAPQVKNFEPYGLKADIWSIGVIFFHMLFGKCPFESKQNFNKVMLRISGVLDKQEFYEGVKISSKVRKFFEISLSG